jgi:hypothetical protein
MRVAFIPALTAVSLIDNVNASVQLRFGWSATAQSDAHKRRRLHDRSLRRTMRAENSLRLTRETADAVPMATAAHSSLSDYKSVIVCAAIDVDRLSGDEASVLTD